MVHRRDREVALLVAGLVAEVGRPRRLAPVFHDALDRVDEVVARVLVLVEADVVEDVELGLGPEVGGVGDAGATAGTPRPSWRRSAGRGCSDSPVTGSCTKQLMMSVLRAAERVDRRRCSGSGIRIMSDSWISWKPRIDEPSKPRPSSNDVLGQLLGRDREVLHLARAGRRSGGRRTRPLVGDEGQDVGSRLAHGAPFGWVAKRERGVFSPFPVSMPLLHRERCVSSRRSVLIGSHTTAFDTSLSQLRQGHSQSLCRKM